MLYEYLIPFKCKVSYKYKLLVVMRMEVTVDDLDF
jgi:hypothetical protein